MNEITFEFEKDKNIRINGNSVTVGVDNFPVKVTIKQENRKKPTIRIIWAKWHYNILKLLMN